MTTIPPTDAQPGEDPPEPVAWLVFHPDDTHGLRLFASELAAYRAAHADRMEVVGVLDGETTAEARKRTGPA